MSPKSNPENWGLGPGRPKGACNFVFWILEQRVPPKMGVVSFLALILTGSLESRQNGDATVWGQVDLDGGRVVLLSILAQVCLGGCAMRAYS